MPSATPAAAAGALAGRRLGDLLDLQLLDLVAVAVALDPAKAGIDHAADARHGERGLGHVGGQHHRRPLDGANTAPAPGPTGGEQRQHLGAAAWCLAQGLGGLADLALAGQEHQHRRRGRCAGFVDRIDQRVVEVAVGAAAVGRLGLARRGGRVGLVAPRRAGSASRWGTAGPTPRSPARACRAEVAREALGVEGGGGDDQLEIGPLGEQLAQVAEQKSMLRLRSWASSMISVS